MTLNRSDPYHATHLVIIQRYWFLYMARRNDHTREELVELTLEQVKSFLQQHPHHELSLRKIAGMIGYVPSTLINVFGSYNLLLLEAVNQTMDEIYHEFEQILQQELSPIETFELIAYCYHDYAVANPYRWQLIFQHSMNGTPLPEHAVARISRVTGLLESLTAATAAERKTQYEILEASRVLWASVHGITGLSMDDAFFASSKLEGKVLIKNFLDSYLSQWQK